MQKKCTFFGKIGENICVYQEKVVILQPINIEIGKSYTTNKS